MLNFSLKKINLKSSLLARNLLTLCLVYGCGGTSKKPSAPAVQNAPVTSQPAASAVVGPVEKQSPEILTQSVARVIGFSDVGGRSVTLYQDAYSALYPALKQKKAAVSADSPVPLIYYSPVFTVEKATSTLDEKGDYKITLINSHTADRMRPKLAEDVSSALVKLGIDKTRLGPLPLQNVVGTVKAFAKSYSALVNSDFSTAVVVIPKGDVPLGNFDAQGNLIQKNGKKGGIEIFDIMSINYSYKIQKSTEQACSVNVDEDYIKKMYLNGDCPPLFATPADSVVASLADSKPEWKGLPDLLKQIQNPITRCIAGREVENVLSKSSINCTRTLSDANGNKRSALPALNDFAASTWMEPVKNAVLTDNSSNWDVNAVAAAVKMFGSPDAFVQEINKFNTNILNMKSSTVSQNSLDESHSLLTMLDQLDYHNSEEKSSSGSSGGGFIFLISFSSNNSHKEMSKSVTDILKNVSSSDLEDRKTQLNKLLKENGMTHEIVNVGGVLKFYPHVKFAVKEDIKKIREAGNRLSNVELGNIILEPDNVTVELSTRTDSNLLGIVDCDGQLQTFVQSIQIDEWWKSVGFMQNLSKTITDKLPPMGCANVGLKFWYEADSASGLVQDQLLWNVRFSSIADMGKMPQTGFSGVTLTSANSGQADAAKVPNLRLANSAGGSVQIGKIEISR